MPIDVTQVSSPEPVVEEVSSEVVAPTEQQEQVVVSEEISTTPPSSGEGELPVSEVDEKGVPYENRYREAQRKLVDKEDRLAKMEETLTNIQKSVTQPDEQKFTYEQLETWEKQNPEDAKQYGDWIATQKKEAIERDVMEKVTTKLQVQQNMQQESVIRQQSFHTVAQQFPEAFAKDANGRLVDWDVKSPLTQRIIYYMESGAKERADGLVYAAKLAAYDISQGSATQNQQTIQSQQATIGDLQRKTAIEGGGVSHSTDTHATAVSLAAQTGNELDAQKALKSMLLRRGHLAE